MPDTDPASLVAALLPAPRSLELTGQTATLRAEHARAIAPVTRSALRPGDSCDGEGIRYETAIEAGGFDGASDEAYRIEIAADGVSLTAAGERGLLHAGRTLRQLLNTAEPVGDGRVTLSTCVIDDAPDFVHRGVMLDVSRDRVPTMANLYEFVDRLAAWKFNAFQLYMEHTFAYPGHETVWAHASPISPEEVRALDAFCHDRGIELTPNQNSFGHMERWLRHDAYKPLAETTEPWETAWGEVRSHPSVLCPGEPEAEALIDDLYTKLLPNFASKRLNVGCDETWELGQGRSKDDCNKRGEGRVYLDFLLKVCDLAKRHGRAPMFWGDIVLKHPELIGELPGDVVALNWGYEANHPFAEECPRFAEAGVPFWVCPSTCTFRALTGRADVSQANLLLAAEHGLTHGAQGNLITIWGDSGHWQPEGTESIGLTFGAGVAWCGAANRDRDAAELAGRFWFGDDTGEAGRAWHELGLVHASFEGQPNYLAWALIDDDAAVRDGRLVQAWRTFEPITAAQVAAGRARLDAAEAHLRRGRPGREGTARNAAEFDVAVRMTRHALDNLEARIAQHAEHDADLDDATRRRLADDLEAILADYRANWLARSRPGGLDDSVAPLERRLRAYRGG